MMRGSPTGVLVTLAILGALGSMHARADAPVEISWDQELAHDFDRENYQRLLTGIVQTSYALVSAELGLPLQGPLRIKVYT